MTKRSHLYNLPDELQIGLEYRLRQKVSSPQIAVWLTQEGYDTTASQVDNFRRSRVPVVISDAEVVQVSKLATADNSAKEVQENLLLNICSILEDVSASYKTTNDLRAARCVSEITKVAADLCKTIIDQEQKLIAPGAIDTTVVMECN